MKKLLTKLSLVAALATSALAGFGTGSSNSNPVYLEGSDGNPYQYVIGTASSTGSYYKAGKTLQTYLGQDRQTGKPLASAETTDGTGQNFLLMEDGIVNIIFAQGDMVARLKAKHPAFFEGKVAIPLDRPENVQLIMREGMDEDDLQNKNAKVFVGLPNSGGAGSWENIVSLEPGYGKAQVFTGDIDIVAIQMLQNKEIDAIVRTSYLNPSSDEFAHDVVQTQKSKNPVYFADFNDRDLNDSIDLGNGSKPIYKFVDTVVEKGFFNTTAETLETNVYLIIDKKNMSKDQFKKILRIVKTKKLF